MEGILTIMWILGIIWSILSIILFFKVWGMCNNVRTLTKHFCEQDVQVNQKPQNQDDLWFYVRDNNGTRSYSYSYKGSTAFWIVQFLCMTSDAPKLEDLFYLWANSVEVE